MGKTNNSNNLSKEDIVGLYNYLARFETEIKLQYGHFDFNDKVFRQFCAQNNIIPKVSKDRERNTTYCFWFNTKADKKTKVNDTAHHLLRHIRNSIAHSLVEKKGKIYYFKDYNLAGNQSMGGHLRTDLFWPFLEKLISTKK